MEKPNRSERRRNKFGGGRSSEHGGWPTVEPNPVFHAETPVDEEETERPKALADADRPDPAKKAAEPKAAEPKTAEANAAEPKTAEANAAEPKAAEPKAAEPDAAEPKAAEPKAAASD